MSFLSVAAPCFGSHESGYEYIYIFVFWGMSGTPYIYQVALLWEVVHKLYIGDLAHSGSKQIFWLTIEQVYLCSCCQLGEPAVPFRIVCGCDSEAGISVTAGSLAWNLYAIAIERTMACQAGTRSPACSYVPPSCTLVALIDRTIRPSAALALRSYLLHATYTPRCTLPVHSCKQLHHNTL